MIFYNLMLCRLIMRKMDIMIKTVQKYILVPQTDEDEKK